MSDEPTYVYVRGTGWVPSTCGNTFADNTGKRWRIEQRMPKDSEFWDGTNAKRTIEDWTKLYMKRTVHGCPVFHDDSSRYEPDPADWPNVVVFVPA
jgi:hypothetical protein